MPFKRHSKQSASKSPSNDTLTAGNSNPGLRIRSADSRAHTHSSSMPNVATHPSNPLVSVMRRAARPIRRFLGRNASSVQESGVGPGVTQLSPDSKSTPSLLPSDQNIRKVPSTSNTSTVGGDKAVFHPQPVAKQDYLAPLAVPTSDSSSAALAGDGTETVLGAIKLSLQTASSVLKFVPVAHLDEIPTLLLSWIQIYETVRGNADGLDGLCEGIHKAWHSVVEPIQNWRGDRPPGLETLASDFRRALEKQFGNVILLLGQNVVKKTVQATDIAQQITAMKTCLNDAISRFQLRISTLDFLHTHHLFVQSELRKLTRLPADYKRVQSKSECLQTTRVVMRQSVLEHLGEVQNRFFWLRGSPGTGKTAISLSIASTLANQGRLAASFFWDKNQKDSGLDSTEMFPSTLARQLAIFSEDFKLSLVKHLQREDLELASSLGLEEQVKALIIGPMCDLKELWLSSEKRFIIILDGLDECGDQETLENLMKAVLLLDGLPINFAVFVGSRPETQITSAWTAKFGPAYGNLPCEDLDNYKHDPTVLRMVQEKLADCIQKSEWKPLERHLRSFASACRGLPIIAEMRIRDVRRLTQRGADLQSEFEYFCNLKDAPTDVHSEYLRVFRRAYMSNSEIRPHVAETYRKVMGMIIAAHDPQVNSVHSLSRLLEMTEDKVWKSLEPISSILNLPLDNTETIDFYHATAREFITSNPVVTDKAFFIDDVEGYFIGFRLLALVNDIIDRNLYGIPTETSSGGANKWKNFQEQLRNLPGHVKYALRHLFDHLDPSQLFSRDENELQHKFERFITHNLSSYLALNPRFLSSHVPDRLRHQVQHHPIRLLNETAYYNEHLLSIPRHPWRYHPSSLRFFPPSSELFKQYGHLSVSRIRIFCFGDQLSHGNAIPLSKATLMLQSVVSSDAPETRTIPVESRWLAHKFGAVDYKAEFDHTGTRNGTVTSAAISPDGRYVALGFGNGMIEVADIDDRCAVSQFQCDASNHPIWIEFVSGDCRIAVEDNKGRVIIFARGAQPVRLKDPLPVCRYSVVTAVPQDRSLIVRAPGDEKWYKSVVVLSVSDRPSIRCLPFPRSNSFHSGSKHTAQSSPEFPSIPFRGSLGFSPGARYVGAYDMEKAFVWSMESHELIAYYQVPSCPTWMLNPGVGSPPSSYARHKPMFLRRTHPEAMHRDLDETWLNCPFYDISKNEDGEVHSSMFGRTPLLHRVTTTASLDQYVISFDGRELLFVPNGYHPIRLDSRNRYAWYGDRMPLTDFYHPRSSRDGTRFLLQGHMKAPLVIEIV